MRWSAAPRFDQDRHTIGGVPVAVANRVVGCHARCTAVSPRHTRAFSSNAPQALREIQASPYAKRVFDQVKAEEATKQAEAKAKEAEFKAAAEKAAIVGRPAPPVLRRRSEPSPAPPPPPPPPAPLPLGAPRRSTSA